MGVQLLCREVHLHPHPVPGLQDLLGRSYRAPGLSAGGPRDGGGIAQDEPGRGPDPASRAGGAPRGGGTQGQDSIAPQEELRSRQGDRVHQLSTQANGRYAN